MKKLILLLLLVGFGMAQECTVDLEMTLHPSGSKATVDAKYLIDCNSDRYLGQVNNFRMHLQTGKDLVVSDDVGALKPAENDPDYFKLTNMDDYYLLSVRPRTGIVVGPGGNEYALTVSYPAKDILEFVEANTKFTPKDAVIKPKLMIQIGNMQTLVDAEIRDYTFKIDLPDGSELKESSIPCTVSQGTLTCETDASEIEGLSMVWREKPLSEKVAQKGTPWILAGITNFFGKLIGGII